MKKKTILINQTQCRRLVEVMKKNLLEPCPCGRIDQCVARVHEVDGSTAPLWVIVVQPLTHLVVKLWLRQLTVNLNVIIIGAAVKIGMYYFYCHCFLGLMFSINSCTRGQRKGLLRCSALSSHRVQQSHTTTDNRERLTLMQRSGLLPMFLSLIIELILHFAPVVLMARHDNEVGNKNKQHYGDKKRQYANQYLQ